MAELVNNPLFGLGLTLFTYGMMEILLKKVRIPLLNPLIASIVIIICLLKFTGISYEAYDAGASILTLMITPATVALAYPLYQNFDKLKENWLPVLSASTVGVIVNCVLSVAIGKFFQLNSEVIVSTLPKSVTTAISLDLSAQMGGITAVTFAVVVVTGIFGALVASQVFKLFRIKSPVAQGIALGSTCHAVGTGRAIEIGQTEGILAGLCISVNGIVTVLLLPTLYQVVDKLM
ncbi:MAG: LrgB family protein [Enterococcus sp.]